MTPQRTDMRPQVNRRLRLLVPVIVLVIAAAIVAMVVFSPKMTKKDQTANTNATAVAETSATPTEPPVQQAAGVEVRAPDSTVEKDVEPAPVDPATEDASGLTGATPDTPKSPDNTPVDASAAPPPTGPGRSMEGLVLRVNEVPDDEILAHLGSLVDPERSKMRIDFTRTGGGVADITFSNVWLTASAKRQAGSYFAALAAGSTEGYELPPEDMRYTLQRSHMVPFEGYSFEIPVLAANGLQVRWTDGDDTTSLKAPLPLIPKAHWAVVGPGQFKAEVINADGELVLEILRRFELSDGYDITLHQRVVNHSGRALQLQWQQYGPPSLNPDRARYLDRRRFRFGYEFSSSVDPGHMADVIASGDMLLEYSEVSKGDDSLFWPNDESQAEGFTLSWFASTSRYFTMTVHPILGLNGEGNRSLEGVVERVERSLYTIKDDVLILTGLFSPFVDVPTGGQHDFSMGIYAGPMSPQVLDEKQPYKALNMGGLLLYQISGFGCCAFCTFQWLAEFLLMVLGFLAHSVVFDWGIAIIILVMMVRILLHPITRMSQVSMQKFSRQMQKMKPEMDRLREKYGGDKKKIQAEQMRLMRENGINPLQMLGCLPMVLQMPVWIALYAGLYFSYDLRQEPAFWGFFQLFDNWAFLADLASPDHFFYEFSEPHQFLFWHLTGINLLPILLGVFFYIQQKYLTPQNAAMTPEQQTQQKMIRIMTVVMFPLFLYTAPSGLTLYIMTSSIVGTLEGRHIRKQVDLMDLDTKPGRAEASTIASRATLADGPRVAKDAQSRAYSKMIDRRKGGQSGKGKGNSKKRR